MDKKSDKKYIPVNELEIYKLARQLSKLAWEIHGHLSWQYKKIIGDQFITATDSFGANIVEGYSRFHFLDKIKFFYNSRASLAEANDYWLDLLEERDMVSAEAFKNFKELSKKSFVKLQNFISAVYKAKSDSQQ